MGILSNRTRSLFGNVPYVIQKRICKWNKMNNLKNKKILIVDDKDGHIGLCPLRYGIHVDIYELNNIFVNGGSMEVPVNIPDTTDYIFAERSVKGLRERINIEFINTPYEVQIKNYYAVDEFKEYEYVIACRSLSRIENKQYSMDYKINKLKSNVKKDGYIYIEYYVALKDDDFKSYPENEFLRKDEILKYFPETEWNVFRNEYEIVEDNLTPFNREKKQVVIGYFDARKKPSKPKIVRKKIEKKTIVKNGNVIKVNHNYTINGCLR